MEGPNPLRAHRKGPKPMNRQALASQNKGKKKSSPALKDKKIIKEAKEKIEQGNLGIPKSLASSGCAARPCWD